MKRVWLPQLALALLLLAGLAGGTGLTVIWHRAWVEPPLIGSVVGPSTTPPLQQQIINQRKVRRLCRDVEAGQFTMTRAKRRSAIRACHRDGF